MRYVKAIQEDDDAKEIDKEILMKGLLSESFLVNESQIIFDGMSVVNKLSQSHYILSP